MVTPEAQDVLDRLATFRRQASIAQIGGFRPPDDPRTSWFGGRGVGAPGETLPEFRHREMVPILQINVTELPYVPEQLADTKLLMVFFDLQEIPFETPHGAGWLIREYRFLEGLAPLPTTKVPSPLRAFPIKWTLARDELPGWGDAWSLIDLGPVNSDPRGIEQFFETTRNHPRTKVGGYPHDVQHEVGLPDYVFQIGSEDKPRLNWVDSGIAYFFKSPGGEWRYDCQFY